MAGNSAEPGRSVTSKVVAILLAFHDGDEHSLTEIARLTCLPVSTAHRLVTELAGWGVLERTEESTFRVGLPVKAMAGRGSHTPALIESARRVLEDLVTAARTGASLGILTDTGVAYIEKRCDHSPVTTFAQTARLPVHATALGKALLATLPGHDRRSLLAEQGMRPFTPNTVTEPAQLETELAGLGPGDPVTEAGQFRDRVSCAGVAVPGTDPGSWWALGISARGLDLPGSLLGGLQFAAADLTATPPRR